MAKEQFNPYDELGLPQGAQRDEIKRAFRQLALQVHPDIDPSPEAAKRFLRIRKAADTLLHKGARDMAAYDAQALRRAWQPSPSEVRNHWQRSTRSTGATLAFCGAAVAGGVALFMGALYVHQGLYDYNKYIPGQASDKEPTARQLEIQELVRQRREAAAYERAGSGSGGGGPGS